ncbi:MAG: PriCT-2 domain-containing protein [Aeromonas sp.]
MTKFSIVKPATSTELFKVERSNLWVWAPNIGDVWAVPVGKNGPLGKFEEYRNRLPTTAERKKPPEMIAGIVLNGWVLVDWDGYKAGATTESQIAEKLGLTLEQLNDHLFQFSPKSTSKPNDAQGSKSKHYLFWAGDITNLKQSETGTFLPYVDIKCGNQLVHIKPGKTIRMLYDNSAEKLRPKMPAPEALIAFLTKSERKAEPVDLNRERTPLETIREALSYIDADCSRDAWIRNAMAIKSEHEGEEGFDLFHEWSQIAVVQYESEEQPAARRGTE